MIPPEPVLPPEFIYPVEDWKLVECRLAPDFLERAETLFTTANGYLGLRGGYEEGTPAHEPGTFINGFHESWPIPYGEQAHGFATTGQTLVNVPDGKIIRLYVDDEVFALDRATVIGYRRVLDLRAGTLDRNVVWETPTGKRVQVRSRRLVSLTDRHLAAISYEVTVHNDRASVILSSELTQPRQPKMLGEDDPRLARRLDRSVLVPEAREDGGYRLLRGFTTHSSRMTLACGFDHTLETECECSMDQEEAETADRVVFSLEAQPGKPIRLIKYLTYHTSRAVSVGEQLDRSRRVLDRAQRRGFESLLADQRRYLDDFWQRADIEVAGGADGRAQQSLRWNLFQLLQATARADGSGIPAKGLTGQGYEGHYFWDMEMYMIPFLVYTDPRGARNLLLFRYRLLDAARKRAREVNQKGALYPWRTINGEEASAFYATGTAQYHINAAIAYAIRRYVEASGDDAFLHRYGAEMLVETARLWYDLGFFSERRDGRFCIHSVTGLDEYATVVDNNTYTNLMARENLRYAAEVVENLSAKHPEAYDELVYRTHLAAAEPGDWRRAAKAMYVAYDERLGVHPQDDNFLEHDRWDFSGTPAGHYPLLLHYHPLVIYRHRVLKQPDVVLAMFLLGDTFTVEQKKRNFDYYDPLTTGDSSLSPSVQGIMAAELGYRDKALAYWKSTLFMDLADVAGNVRDGCHVAALGGTWMAAVYGLAGMREHSGRLSFDPRPYVERLRFALTVRGQRLEIAIENGAATYRLHGEAELVIEHYGERLTLRDGEVVTRPSRTTTASEV